MRFTRLASSAALALLCSSAFPASAKGPTLGLEARQTLHGTRSNDYFARAVAIDGDVAAVGVDDEEQGPDAGAVMIYTRSNGHWTLSQTLLCPDDGEASFGSSLSLLSGTLAVGAPANGGATASGIGGAVYLYTQSGGAFANSQTLRAPALPAEDYFGWSLAMDASTLVIGAQGTNASQGSVFVYDLAKGAAMLRQTLDQSISGVPGGQFGMSVALSGNVMMAGAHGAPEGMIAARGQVALFVRDAMGDFAFQSLLTLATQDVSARCGVSLAMANGVALVGCPSDPVGGGVTGSVSWLTGSDSTWTEQGSFTLADTPGSFSFGTSLSTDGTKFVVGGIGPDANTVARVFSLSAGVLTAEQTFTGPSASTPQDIFANHDSVAISGTTVCLGEDQANGFNTAVGDVETYDGSGNTWTAGDTLYPPVGLVGDEFGASVASDGTYLVVGSPAYNGYGPSSGRVEVFQMVSGSWTSFQVLEPADLAAGDAFGRSVALAGTQIVVGAPHDAQGGDVTGAAYIFDFFQGAFSQSQKLTPGNQQMGQSTFGASVATDGTLIAVGDPQSSILPPYSGAGYVFENGEGWYQADVLIPDSSNEHLGVSAAIFGDMIVLGANGGSNQVGKAYVFHDTGDGWAKVATLDRPSPQANEYFGTSLATDGTSVLVGAQSNGSSPGLTYEFTYAANAWTYVGTVGVSTGTYYGYPVSLLGNFAVIGEGILAGGGTYHLLQRDGVGGWTEQTKFQQNPGSDGIALLPDRVLVGSVGQAIAGSVTDFTIAGAKGVACSVTTDCASGFCTEGVCCDTACGGTDYTDCQACSVAAGAKVDGTCGIVASTYVCRQASGEIPCDVPESCDGTTAVCPPDLSLPDGSSCSNGVCEQGNCVASSMGGASGAGGASGSGGAAGEAAGGAGGIGGKGGQGGAPEGGAAGSSGGGQGGAAAMSGGGGQGGGGKSGASGAGQAGGSQGGAGQAGGGHGGAAGTSAHAGRAGLPDLWGSAGTKGTGGSSTSTGTGTGAGPAAGGSAADIPAPTFADAEAGDSGGCGVAHSQSQSGAGLLFLVLALGARRRSS